MADNQNLLPGSKLPKLSIGNASKLPSLGKLPTLGSKPLEYKSTVLPVIGIKKPSDTDPASSENHVQHEGDLSVTTDVPASPSDSEASASEVDNAQPGESNVSGNASMHEEISGEKLDQELNHIWNSVDEMAHSDAVSHVSDKFASVEKANFDTTSVSDPVEAHASVQAPAAHETKSAQLPKFSVPSIGGKIKAGPSIIPAKSDAKLPAIKPAIGGAKPGAVVPGISGVPGISALKPPSSALPGQMGGGIHPLSLNKPPVQNPPEETAEASEEAVSPASSENLESSEPVAPAAPSVPSSPVNPAPSFGAPGIGAPASPSVPSSPVNPAPSFGAPGIGAPASPSVPSSPVNPAPSFGASPASPESQIVFGGSSASGLSDDDLQWEDEEADELGEKTMTIDSFVDDEDLDDADGEKTQINMSAMDDFEPLSGKLIVESGKTSQREYILVREETTIGRAPKNDIVISDISMSRHHVSISKYPEGFRIKDLESGNGTVLNGYRIRSGQLRHGDIIEIGSIRFRFEQSGGDPDVLWKGEPKVDYHPNQSRHKPTANAEVPAVSIGQQPALNTQKPQMESMLERQGNVSAPAWAAVQSPYTNPYMMSYAGGPMKNVNTPPMWSNILLIFLIVCALGAGAWAIVNWSMVKIDRDNIENMQVYVEKMNQNVKDGVKAYSEKRFMDAITSIQAARAIGTERNLVDEANFFELYLEFLNEESNIQKDIEKVGDKVKKRSDQITLEEYENDLDLLDKVSDSSINKPRAQEVYNTLSKSYGDALYKRVSDLTVSGKLNEAREMLTKLCQLSNRSKDVQELNRLITLKEQSIAQ